MAFDFNGTTFYGADDPVGSVYGDNQQQQYGPISEGGLSQDVYNNAGFQGDINFDAGNNRSDQNFQLTPEFQQWLADTGYHTAGADRGSFTLGGLFDKNNKPIGDIRSFADNPGFDPWGLGMQLAAGAATGGLGAGLGFSGLEAGALSGAAGGMGGAALTGGDPIKGALMGAVGGGLQGYNPASQLGIDNPIAGKIANSSISGAASSLMNGRNPLQGAVSGAINSSIPAFGNYAGSQLSNALNSPQGGSNMDFYDGTTGDSAYENPVNTGGAYNSPLNSMLGYSQAPGMSASTLPDQLQATNSQPTYGQSYATPNFMAGQDNMPQQQQSNPIKELLKSMLMPSSPGNPGSGVGSMVSSLAGLYSGYEQRRRAGQLAGQLSSMYGPNSAYSQTLRQQLDRRDAAAGRRSQYGPREVELQAALATANSKNAPEIQKLYGDQTQGLAQMGRSFVNLGNQTGAFKSLYDYLNGGQ